MKATDPFTPNFKALWPTLRHNSSEYYKARTDLRQCHVKAVLHYSCRFNGSHKLALLRTGEMTFQQMASTIEQVFDCNPMEKRLARADFTADAVGTALQWFAMHMYIPRKHRIRVIPPSRTGTIYFGSGKDLVRVYDKAAQIRSESHEEDDGEEPASVRIERQIRSGRFPPELATLQDLVNNAMHFNPFRSVILVRGGKPHPHAREYSIHRYLEGVGLRLLITANGFARTRIMLAGCQGRNVNRKIRELNDFLPADPEGFELPDLFRIYQSSLLRQLSGSGSETLQCIHSRNEGGRRETDKSRWRKKTDR